MKTIENKNDSAHPIVLIVDDDRLFRRSISRILEGHGYDTAMYESLAQMAATKELPQIGCAILDLNLPDSDGLAIQKQLSTLAPALTVIFVSGFGRVSTSVRAMKAGAIDFLEKPVEDSLLIETVARAVERSKKVHHENRELKILRCRFERLSHREREVFALVTSGLLNKQAAAELGVKEKTVKVHRAQVMSKMGADSFADLVRIAQQLGLNPSSAQPENRTISPR